MVDNDPLSSLTQGLLGPDETMALDPGSTIAAIYSGDFARVDEVVRPTSFPGLDLLPGSEHAARFNDGAPHEKPWELQTCLSEALGELSTRYDHVLVDCPPNLNLCSWAALSAADWVLIPVQPEDYGAQGLPQVTRSIELVRRVANPRLAVLGLVISIYSARRALHQIYSETLRQQYGSLVFEATLPDDPAIPEATMLRKPIAYHKPKGAASKALAGLASELESRLAAAAAPGSVVNGRPPEMSKRDDLMKAGGANVLASMGAGRGPELPVGLDPMAAARRPAHLEGLTRDKAAARISIDRIEADPDQPRREFDAVELEALAESLRTRGQLQPIRVRWDEGRGAYVVLMGERRWRAARMAGLTELACVVQEQELDADDRLAVQLIENALRADLKPIEQANAYQTLMAAKGWSTRQLAAELAIHATTITKALALLDLPAVVREQVELGALAPATAYEVSKLDDAGTQAEVAAAVVEQKLSRSEVADLVQAVRAKRPAPAAKPAPVDIDLGDGVSVVVRWKKASTVGTVQALRRALKLAQDRDRAGEGEAA